MARSTKATRERAMEESRLYHEERRRWQAVQGANGTPVREGTIVLNYRSEPYVFQQVTAFPDGRSEGKVSVKPVDADYKPVTSGFGSMGLEYYPSVFGLKLVRSEDEAD